MSFIRLIEQKKSGHTTGPITNDHSHEMKYHDVLNSNRRYYVCIKYYSNFVAVTNQNIGIFIKLKLQN